MKTHNYILTCFATLALVCGAAPTLAANPTGSAKVLSVNGPASVFEKGSNRGTEVNQGDILEEGDSISTKALSSVALVFSNGSMVTVAENSSLTLTQLKQEAYEGTATYEELQADPSQSETLLSLNYGKVSGEVKNLQADSSFDVETPLGTAVIAGTIFTIEITYDTERGEFFLAIENVGGDVSVVSRFAGSITYGAGNVGDKGYDSSLTEESEESIPDQHTVVIRVPRSDPFSEQLATALSDLAAAQGIDVQFAAAPEETEVPSPEVTTEDPSTQVVSPEGAQETSDPAEQDV